MKTSFRIRMTSLAAASSVALLRHVAFLGRTPLGNFLGSIYSILALTNSDIAKKLSPLPVKLH